MRLARPYSGVFRGGATARTGPHALPLARIKKIMKRSAGDGSGGDGTGARMISGEAPMVFSRACELFVAELTRAAWAATLEGRRRTVHAEDVAAAVRDTDLFDFLADVARAGFDNGVLALMHPWTAKKSAARPQVGCTCTSTTAARWARNVSMRVVVMK